jgi:hypothetical protein
MGSRGILVGFWWGSLKERDHWEDVDIDGRIILKRIFDKCAMEWAGLISFRIEASGKLL